MKVWLNDVPIVDGKATAAGPGPWNSAAIGPRRWDGANDVEWGFPLVKAGDILTDCMFNNTMHQQTIINPLKTSL